MILPGVTGVHWSLRSKLALVVLCLSSSPCYGQSDEESIPSIEISSKEQIHDQNLASYDFFIDEDPDAISATTQAKPYHVPTPEVVSINLMNSTDPIPSLPISLNHIIPAISHSMVGEERSLRLFAENLPKLYLKIPTKNAGALPSLLPENKPISNQRDKQSKSVRPRTTTHVDLLQVFAAAPWIYSILGVLLIYSFGLGFYNLHIIRKSLRCNHSTLKFIIPKIEQHKFEEIVLQCEKDSLLLPRLIATSISCRTWGLPAMLDHMKSEGRRFTQSIWHRIGLLSDVAMIAPLLGLLGTVIGMFYAFNDVSRSANSLMQFMDGLGVSIGTTVAGLIVAISAISFQTVCRDRLARAVVRVEQNALDIARLVSRKSEK